MFNIGGGDKEKLEENMEEIKQLVNDGESTQEYGENTDQTEEFGQDQDFQGEDLQDVVNENVQQQTQQEGLGQVEKDNTGQELGQPAARQEKDLDGLQDDIEDLQSQVTGDETSEPNPQAQQNGGPEENFSETRHTNQPQPNNQQNMNGVSQTQMPDSRNRPKDQQITEGEELDQLEDKIRNHINEIEEDRTSRTFEEDVEKINKKQENTESQQRKEEPLFLEVEKFEDIRDMIEEMHYLTSEMDDVMEHLVVGIEEDQETVDEAGQIIDEFQARRDKIETTLKDN